MDSETQAERLATVETSLKHAHETIASVRAWADAEIADAVDGSNAAAGRVVELDNLLRGQRGSNGIISRVRRLEDWREERQAELRKADRRAFTVWLAILGSALALARSFVD